MNYELVFQKIIADPRYAEGITYGKPRKGHKSTPKDIEWLKQLVKIPVVVKGIMGADDARIAVRAGADVLVVSNHGGRILDFNRSALEALPEVVDAVPARVSVLLDSGIRSGGDIVKAMALGAKAVLIGRPYIWGLAIDGQAGAAAVLEQLRMEFETAMALCGVTSVQGITRGLVRAPWLAD